jgi:hypothetical protein
VYLLRWYACFLSFTGTDGSYVGESGGQQARLIIVRMECFGRTEGLSHLLRSITWSVKGYFARPPVRVTFPSFALLLFQAFFCLLLPPVYFVSTKAWIDSAIINMDLVEQSTDNCMVLPYSIYTPEEVSDGELPFLSYTTEELGGTSLFAKLGSLQTMDLWDLEELGYTYDGLIVRHDGRIEGAQQLPDYYAYSYDRSDTWDEGLQAIEDHDWSASKEEYEADEATNASTAEPTTDRRLETVNLSLTKSNNHNDLSRSPESPEPLVLEEFTDQPGRDEVSSPPCISSPSKIHEDDALSVREDVSGDTVMVPATETDSARDDVSMTDEVVEIDLAEAATTLTSDPRYAIASPAHEELPHDESVIDESKDQPGLDDIVTGFSALMSNPTSKPHGTAALDNMSQNGFERAHSPDSSCNLPVQPSESLAPSIADSLSPASISNEGLQHGSEVTTASASLHHDTADEIPDDTLTSLPSGDIVIKEPGQNATVPEPEEHAEELAMETLENAQSVKNRPESMLTKTNEPEHEEIEQPEDSVAVGEQGRDLPPYATRMEILSIPTNSEALVADDQYSALECSSEDTDQFKRSRSLDDEQEAPAKKKIKANEPAQSTAAESELSSEDVDDTVTLPMAASRRPAPAQWPRETKAGNDKGPMTKRKSKNVSSHTLSYHTI